MTTAIEVNNLWKVFGRRQNEAMRLARDGQTREEILRKTGATVGIADVSFEVEEGELFVLMGLSGCGKSTLLRTINRLNTPTAGKVRIGDTDVTGLSTKELRNFRRKNVGMVFQHFALFPHRTVLENVAYGLEVQGVPKAQREEKAMESLDLVKLTEWAHKSPDSLSGGMRQRVGVARALSIEPEVLLMDEPFSALDPLIRSSMQEDLADIREKLGKTIVFVTHDLDEALTLGDRIAIMREGRIMQLGSPADIAVRPEDDFVEAFVADVNRARVLKAEDLMKKPRAVLKPSTSPKTAVRLMDDHDFETVFVRNPDGTFAGIITLDQALAAVKNGAETIEKYVAEGATATREESVEELMNKVLRTRGPAAILDADNKLVGVVRHKHLLPVFAAGPENPESNRPAAGGDGST